MRHKLGAAAIVVLGILAGCSTRAPSEKVEGRIGSLSQAIQNGDPDGTTHPFAVGVCGGRTGNAAQPCQGYCSGALILPNLIVTARHCVSQSARSIDCSLDPPERFGGLSHNSNSYWITTHNLMKNNPSIGWHHVQDILVPGGTDADIFCGNDIALLVLDDLVPAGEATPIIPNIQYSMSDPKFAHAFTAIGYGGTTADDFQTNGAIRRYRSGIPVLCIPGDPTIPCPKPPNFPENEFVGGTGTCGGDSGSSAFEESGYKKNLFRSFGVLSRGAEIGSVCKQSVYTRLDKWRDFIIDGATQASANWTKYPKPSPDWTGPFVPPPPVPDGGTEDGGTRPPGSKLGIGEACGGDDQCQSALCAGGICAQACNEADVPSSCPEGFECKASVCVTIGGGGTNNASGGSTTTTTSGCSAAPERTSGGASLFVVFGALIYGVARRRRVRRQS